MAVHSDICGPLKHTSRHGFLYFATFVDEGSRYCFTESLARKSDVSNAAKTALLKIGNHFHCNVTYCTTDSAGEYPSKQMDAFYKQHGIQSNPTVPYTPQENGKAERINHTLVSRARAALIMSRLPPEY